ncbi:MULTISPECIES: hypothetical protein [Methylorubrum]|uniref:hypothetical protein n=1 Tax=Methylorubrum TaxID=2282523 RepID=UPI00209D11F4|nr:MULTISPECIES: hypothetical protein [Methylorubrum]MCP1550686.1 hypothetical protein [Methylorubrum zatmanii]MCP1552701.1 hypothetical protein [Methylorubrum extorquens]MCP1580989.1 hypothetical protein [Methylorubrum extorquens]
MAGRMMARQTRHTRPLTPAEAVRQGRKLIVERRRQEASRKAAMEPEAVAQPEPILGPICQPEAAGPGGAEAAIGMPISEQDQGVGGGSLRQSAALSTSDEGPAADPTLIFAATIVSPKIIEHPYGEWPTLALGPRQCRFACTADDVPRDQHRFCGRRTFVGPGNLHGSWCDEHLPRVWGQGSVSERNAHHVTKDVRRFG